MAMDTVSRGSLEGGAPCPGNFHAPSEPHARMSLGVRDEALHRQDASGSTSDSAVKTHRQHLGCGRTFSVERVKAVSEVCEELIGWSEPWRAPELDVVRVERMWHDAPRVTSHIDQIR